MDTYIAEECTQRGISKDVYLKKLRTELSRLYTSLGHPSPRLLLRLLRSGGATRAALQAARELKWSICKSHASPVPHRPAKVRKATTFNEGVGLDCFQSVGLTPHSKQTFLNMVDWAMSEQLCVPVSSEAPKVIWKAFPSWINHFGVPRRVVVDQHGSFSGSFGEEAERLFIHVAYCFRRPMAKWEDRGGGGGGVGGSIVLPGWWASVNHLLGKSMTCVWSQPMRHEGS